MDNDVDSIGDEGASHDEGQPFKEKFAVLAEVEIRVWILLHRAASWGQSAATWTYLGFGRGADCSLDLVYASSREDDEEEEEEGDGIGIIQDLEY